MKPQHTFTVSAYKNSPYLEECVISLKNQLVKSSVIICTSTPDPFIDDIAERHGVPVYVREGASSLKDDWNFAVSKAVSVTGARLITIAHQDDIYDAGYARAMLNAFCRYPDMLLFCTRYRTIDSGGNIINGRAEAVKRALRLPLRFKKAAHLKCVKRSALMFGNSVCCPSCTYNTALTGLPLFTDDDRFVIDWKTLLRISGYYGRFICEERELMSYRVHDGAATRRLIDDHTREREEYEVYSSIWPAPAALLLSRLMRSSYSAYTDRK